jgi:hypothetical protein
MFMDIVMPAFYGLHCILGPAGVIPNLDLIDSLVQKANISIWSMVPSLVDELGETPDVLAKFKSAKFICASGGKSFSPCLDLLSMLRLSRSYQSPKRFQGKQTCACVEYYWHN